MKIVIIDGQGGRIGRLLTEQIIARYPQAQLIAIGTNSIATSNMRKGGASEAATGENAVCVACRNADLIIGSASIAIADSFMGEITPAMALAVGGSGCPKIFLPLKKCDNYFAGIEDIPINILIEKAVDMIESFLRT